MLFAKVRAMALHGRAVYLFTILALAVTAAFFVTIVGLHFKESSWAHEETENQTQMAGLSRRDAKSPDLGFNMRWE